MAGKKYYAVKVGHETGIFTTWDACKAQVQGYSGAVYKSFPTLEEAQSYLSGGEVSLKTASSSAQAAALFDSSSLAADEMAAYVDGSFLLDERRYAFGAVIFYNGKEYRFSGSDNDTALADMRNVAGEIMGAERAFSFALEQGAKVLHVYHDYEGIAKWCTGDWQAKKPGTQAYRAAYLDAKAKGLSIVFHKVKGHSGDTYNELADQLAKSALGIQ